MPAIKFRTNKPPRAPKRRRWIHWRLFAGIPRAPRLPGVAHLCLAAGASSPNSALNPSLAGLGLFFGGALRVFAFFCRGVSLACSFGDQLDVSTHGRSASVGEGLGLGFGFGFGFETGGGDLVKKLKMELCFAMWASLKAFSVARVRRSQHFGCARCTSPSKRLNGARVRGKSAWRLVTHLVQWETRTPPPGSDVEAFPSLSFSYSPTQWRE